MAIERASAQRSISAKRGFSRRKTTEKYCGCLLLLGTTIFLAILCLWPSSLGSSFPTLPSVSYLEDSTSYVGEALMQGEDGCCDFFSDRSEHCRLFCPIGVPRSWRKQRCLKKGTSFAMKGLQKSGTTYFEYLLGTYLGGVCEESSMCKLSKAEECCGNQAPHTRYHLSWGNGKGRNLLEKKKILPKQQFRAFHPMKKGKLVNFGAVPGKSVEKKIVCSVSKPNQALKLKYAGGDANVVMSFCDHFKHGNLKPNVPSVWIIRDPRDVVMSEVHYFEHSTNLTVNGTTLTLAEALTLTQQDPIKGKKQKRPKDKKKVFGFVKQTVESPLNLHLNRFIDLYSEALELHRQRAGPILVVRYEELNRGNLAVLRQLHSFFGLGCLGPFDAGAAQAALAATSVEKLREVERTAGLVGSGRRAGQQAKVRAGQSFGYVRELGPAGAAALDGLLRGLAQRRRGRGAAWRVFEGYRQLLIGAGELEAPAAGVWEGTIQEEEAHRRKRRKNKDGDKNNRKMKEDDNDII